ncbi:MFS transporter [Nocardia sp. BMG111209]|uniref:MFS transporter n=1 Tax=Nocardia sp. BMG111209 TaxID=1160137 RepID=UPI00036AD8E8|nr:MFS transporter [Nocardia sp. BMG111209]
MVVSNESGSRTASPADRLIARMERIPVSRFHARVVGPLAAGTFFDAFDIVSIGTVLAAISSTFHLGPGQAGMLVSAGFIGQGVGAIGFGLVADRLGRRGVFLASLLVMGTFALISAFSWSIGSLAAIRLIQGFGLGVEAPAASAMLGEFVASSQRGLVTVLYKLASPLGNLATSLASAVLLATVSHETAWRVLFAVGAVPVLIAALSWRVLPESPRALIRRGRLDAAERTIAAMEAAAGVEPGAESTTDPVVADAAPTRLGELVSRRYRIRSVTAWVLWFSVYFTLLGGTVWMPSLYVKLAHVSQSTASLASAGVNGVVIAMIVAVGLTVDRVGRRRWFLTGYLVSAIGAVLAVLFAATGHLNSVPALLLTGGLMLAAVGGIDPLVYAYTAEIYPTRMRSWGVLSASAWRCLAVVIAPTVIGWILDAGGGAAAVFGLFLGVLVVGGAVTLRWGVETRQLPLEALSR